MRRADWNGLLVYVAFCSLVSISHAEVAYDLPIATIGGYISVDIDGDGIEELLGAFVDINIHKSVGFNKFSQIGQIEPQFERYISLAKADFDLDSDEDIFAIDVESINDTFDMVWFENTQTLDFPRHTILGGIGYTVDDFNFIVDLDSDGDPDVVLRNGNWFNNLGGDFIEQSTGLNSLRLPTYVDWDGDGDLDIVQYFNSWQVDGVRVYFNNGSEVFTSYNSIWNEPVFFEETPYTLDVLDLNRDNDLDIIIDFWDGINSYQTTRVWLSPQYQTSFYDGQLVNYIFRYEAIDWNMDGNCDLFIHDLHENLGVLLVAPTGLQLNRFDVDREPGVPYFCDMDGDGDLDCVIDRDFDDYWIQNETIHNLTVEVELTPEDSIITIPPTGGSFQFDAEIRHNLLTNTIAHAWTGVEYPDGSQQLLSFTRLQLRPGVFIVPDALIQEVPGGEEPGEYLYIARVGLYPDLVVAADTLHFSVEASATIPGSQSVRISEPWSSTSLCEVHPIDINESITTSITAITMYNSARGRMTVSTPERGLDAINALAERGAEVGVEPKEIQQILRLHQNTSRESPEFPVFRLRPRLLKSR